MIALVLCDGLTMEGNSGLKRSSGEFSHVVQAGDRLGVHLHIYSSPLRITTVITILLHFKSYLLPTSYSMQTGGANLTNLHSSQEEEWPAQEAP